MKIVPVICFALATAVAGSLLPVSSSHAQTYLTNAQNCASTGYPLADEGVGNCKNDKHDRGSQERSASAGHSRSGGHGGGGRGR